MKIEAKKLHAFLKKASLDGAIETSVLRCEDNTITTKAKSGNSLAVIASLKAETEEMVLPIKSMKTLLKVLNTFNGEICIEAKGNVMKLFDTGREADLVVAKEEFVDNEIKEELPFKYEASFPLQGSVLKQALTNAEILGSETFIMQVKDKAFSISSNKDKSDSMTEKTTASYDDCKLELGPIAVNVFKVVGDVLKVGMKNNYPIRIDETTEEQSIQYFIAPLEDVENDDAGGKVQTEKV